MNEEIRFIVFSINGERYALNLKDVAVVAEPMPTYPIPRAPRCFVGGINFHGGIVALIDPSLLLDATDTSDTVVDGGERKVLVLDRRHANLALQVESVQTIINEEAILEEDVADNELFVKVLVLADGVVSLFDVEAMLEKLEGLVSTIG